MNPFCATNLKTNYNMTPYGDHGTERVKKPILIIARMMMPPVAMVGGWCTCGLLIPGIPYIQHPPI